MKTLALTVQKLLARLKFSINRSITKVNFTGYKNWLVPTEGLVTSNTHVKYQSSSTHCSKVISKVEVYNK